LPKRAAAACRQLAAFHAINCKRIKMSGESHPGGAVKRSRQQLVEDSEDAPASLDVAVHAEPLTLLALEEEEEEKATEHTKLPLTLLAVVKCHFDALVWMQLCNAQGVSVFSFVRLAPRVSRPFAGAAVYDMSLTHAERLCAVGSGLKGRLVRLLSLGVGRHFEPQRNWGACRKMMQSNVRRVAAGLAAAVRDKAAKEAEELCASGQCAAAVVPLQLAIYLGDLPSLALYAWLHIGGREGVDQDAERGFELAEEGARLGCHHCQGVMAYIYQEGYAFLQDEPGSRPQVIDDACSLELALESSGRGSRYGQFTLGQLHHNGKGGLARDRAQAVAFYRLAAAQGLDLAQFILGNMHKVNYNYYGDSDGVVDQDDDEAMRWYKLAAAQGHPYALYEVAECYEYGRCVAEDVNEAIRWYRRAQVAGHYDAECKLLWLCSRELT